MYRHLPIDWLIQIHWKNTYWYLNLDLMLGEGLGWFPMTNKLWMKGAMHSQLCCSLPPPHWCKVQSYKHHSETSHGSSCCISGTSWELFVETWCFSHFFATLILHRYNISKFSIILFELWFSNHVWFSNFQQDILWGHNWNLCKCFCSTNLIKPFRGIFRTVDCPYPYNSLVAMRRVLLNAARRHALPTAPRHLVGPAQDSSCTPAI